jgi:hypothetical protein
MYREKTIHSNTVLTEEPFATEDPDICLDIPNIEVSDGKYKTSRRYADGRGGLITLKAFEALKKADESIFCAEGEEATTFNHQLYYNYIMGY